MPSTRRTPHLVILTLASALVTSVCQKSLPTAPSELAEGLVVYEDDNFRGKSAHLTSDTPDLEKFNGPCVKQETITLPDGRTTVDTQINSWDNCISSVKVAAGWRAILYGDDDYRGGRIEVTSDIPDLGSVAGPCERGLNDCVSSIRIFRP